MNRHLPYKPGRHEDNFWHGRRRLMENRTNWDALTPDTIWNPGESFRMDRDIINSKEGTAEHQPFRRYLHATVYWGRRGRIDLTYPF